MSLVQDANAMWVDTPSTQPGGLRLNDNFTELGTRSPKSTVSLTFPSPTNDSTQGYARGSRWIDSTTNHIYICANPFAGAAVWKDVTRGISSGTYGHVIVVGGDNETPIDSSFGIAIDNFPNTFAVRSSNGDLLARNLLPYLFQAVHLQDGVTGDGSDAYPYVGFVSALNASEEGTVWLFQANKIFEADQEIQIANSYVILQGSNAILRSSQVAHPNQSVTSITTEASLLGLRAVVTKTAHGYSAGDQILIENADQPEYNLCATIYDVDSNTFKYYIDGTPATPATGTITMRKARVLLKVAKAYQPTFALDMLWGGQVEGLILDGRNNIEVGLYLRCWMGGNLNRVKFRNFREYHAKATENVNCRFNELHAVYGAAWTGVSTTPTKNYFLFGERDPNPIFHAEFATPPGELIWGSFNLTIQDIFAFGATQTQLYIPDGFNTSIINGNCGGAATCIRFGNESYKFNIIDVDCEYGGKIIIDGYKHTILRANIPGALITIDGVGNTISTTNKGNHILRELDRLSVTNNCDAYSEVINSDVTFVGGTHPEKIVQAVDSGLRTVVNGPAIRQMRSVIGAPVGYTNYCQGNRAGHYITTPAGTFLIDINADIDTSDPAAVASNAAARILLKNCVFFGSLTAGNIFIDGNGLRYGRIQSDDGSNVAFDMLSNSQVGGFIALTANGHLFRIGNGLPDQTIDADVLAATAIEIGTANNVKIINNLVFGTTTGTKIGTATTQKLAFWNVTPIVQPTVTGSRASGAALADLLTKLASTGIIVDGTSA